MHIPSRRAIQAGILGAALLLGGLVASAPPAGAANTAGGLDPTFGNGGKVLANLGSVGTIGDALLQSSGDIVISGGFGLARFLPSGAVDSSFGQGGKAATSDAGALAPESDGGLISAATVSTSTGQGFGVARFTANGSPLQSFGSGGTATATVIPSTTSGFFTNVAALVQPADGKILVGGTFELSGYRGGGFRGVLARFNADGSLDTGFASGGSLVSSSITQIKALGLDAAGDIFVMPSFAEFGPSGQVDTSATAPGSLVATSHDGSSTFLVNGQAAAGNSVVVFKGNSEIQAQRFTGSGGTVSTSPLFHYAGGTSASRDSASAIAIDSSGRAVVGGGHFLNTSVFGLARVNADGSLDTTFGTGGVLTTNLQGDDAVAALVIQPDGKIVAIGYSENNSTGQTSVALARYLG